MWAVTACAPAGRAILARPPRRGRRCRPPNRGAARRSIVGAFALLRLPCPRPSVHQSLMQDGRKTVCLGEPRWRWEAGARVPPTRRSRYPAYAPAWNQLGEAAPTAQAVYAAARAHPRVKAWLRAFTFHFTPTLMLLGPTPSKAGLPSLPGNASKRKRLHLDHRAAGRHYFIADGQRQGPSHSSGPNPPTAIPRRRPAAGDKAF